MRHLYVIKLYEYSYEGKFFYVPYSIALYNSISLLLQYTTRNKFYRGPEYNLNYRIK